jgi:hypothetical protein
MRVSSFCAALPLTALLLLPGSARGQRAPAPDPVAIAAATDLQRSGATAEVVARTVMSTYRQSGPQMLQILASVRYPTADIGRAVAAETRASSSTSAAWMVQAGYPSSQAYAILFGLDRSSATAVRSLVEAGYSVRDAVSSRQGTHPASLTAHVSDLRLTRASPGEIGVALSGALGASAASVVLAMKEAGSSLLEIALALRDGYQLSPAQIGTLLVAENYSAVQILATFLDPAFGLGELAAVTAFRGFGGKADNAATLLMQRGRNVNPTTTILTQAGYQAGAVGDAITKAFQSPVQVVFDALVDAGHTLTAAAQWMQGKGVSGPDAVVILRSAGAGARENAAALLTATIVLPNQGRPFSQWARQAGYGCGETAEPLRHEFQARIDSAAVYLFSSSCSLDETSAALDAAYQSTTGDLIRALAMPGIGASAVIRSVLKANHTVALSLTAAVTVLGETVQATAMMCMSTLADVVSLKEVFAWLKANSIDAGTAATWARNAEVGATAVAVALRDGFGATNVAVGNALFTAGFTALEMVTAMKNGIKLTLEEMTALATQLQYNAHDMSVAIIQNFND